MWVDETQFGKPRGSLGCAQHRLVGGEATATAEPISSTA